MLERYPSRRARRMSPGSRTAPRAATCAGETSARSLGQEPRVAHPVGDPCLDREPCGEAGALDDLEGVRPRHDQAAPGAVAPESAPVLEDPGRQRGRARDPGGPVHRAERRELDAPGRVEEPEPHAGVGAFRQAELGHRLVQQRLEVGVPVEAGEKLEGEAVRGDVGRVADREGLLALGRRALGEPLVRPADRVEGEDVVEEALPRGPDRLARLSRRKRRSGRAVPAEEVRPRVDVGDDVAEAGPVDLDGGGVAGEPCLAGGRIELGEGWPGGTGGETADGEAQPEGVNERTDHVPDPDLVVTWRRVAPFPSWRTASHAGSTRSRTVRGSRPRRRAVSP